MTCKNETWTLNTHKNKKWLEAAETPEVNAENTLQALRRVGKTNENLPLTEDDQEEDRV